MKKYLLFLIILTQLSTSFAKNPVDYVDPFIGTSSSRWMLFPGPCLPYGMVKLSPDNSDEWAMDAGYEYTVESICGFNHVHSWMMNGFLMVPAVGKIKIQPGTKENPDVGYRSRFNHQNESASPGYYKVLLDDYNITAELTATTRAGFQKYTFPQTDSAHVVLDLNIPEEEKRSYITQAFLKKVSDRELEGAVSRHFSWNEYTIYFVLRFNQPFTKLTGWVADEISSNIDSIATHEHNDIGAIIHFNTNENPVLYVQSGISYVSVEQARLNMETELAPFGWDFDAVVKNSKKIWNDLLSRIMIEDSSEINKIKFYTNFYRSYSARTIFSDVNGKYTDMCENIRQLKDPNSPVYGCDAFWNTFWNLNQLWALVDPTMMNNWVNSLLEIYDKGGWLPKGPGGIEYSGIMVASHAIPIIVAAYQQGIRNFDAQKAYEAIKKIQTHPGRPHKCGGHVGNMNLVPYLNNGYIPTEQGPVSNVLEYAYDDWCTAQMAKSLGYDDDYKMFTRRSQYYKNVFDQETKYIRPKHNGGPWLQDFNPSNEAVGKEDNYGNKDYIEGNAWQYSWFVPHDLPGLIELMGRDEFNNRLEQGFEKSRPRFVSNYVNHSNQPNMQAAYLFNYSGKPWLTQKWTREILDHYYGADPVNGYPGDEDQGQMGAWYVMSAMGLFQMDGGASGRPFYEISSPLFQKISIKLDANYFNGQKFVIETKNNSDENRYIQSAMLNGKPLDRFWFYRSEIQNGGHLVLEMGPEPNKQWGTKTKPPQRQDNPQFITTPYTSSPVTLFMDSVTVRLTCDTKDTKIYYTLDDNDPLKSGHVYEKPFITNETTIVKMIAIKGDNKSLAAQSLFQKANIQPCQKGSAAKPGLEYKYYQGMFSHTKDFTSLQPIKTGITETPSVKERLQDQYFAFTFEGYIDIPKTGIYRFYLNSNDGSVLYLDDSLLIDNDGLHSFMEKFADVALEKGLHQIKMDYFQEGGGYLLKLGWKGPNFEKQIIPREYYFHK